MMGVTFMGVRFPFVGRHPIISRTKRERARGGLRVWYANSAMRKPLLYQQNSG